MNIKSWLFRATVLATVGAILSACSTPEELMSYCRHQPENTTEALVQSCYDKESEDQAFNQRLAAGILGAVVLGAAAGVAASARPSYTSPRYTTRCTSSSWTGGGQTTCRSW